jgi:AraC-like DNA-binding protein
MESANALADADDPMIRTYTRRFLRSLPPPHARDVVDRVRELVELLLPLRRCTMPRVARALGVTKRTLHRLLAARQESFAAIVDDARAGLAERYLATDRYTISNVSDRLASPRPARSPDGSDGGSGSARPPGGRRPSDPPSRPDRRLLPPGPAGGAADGGVPRLCAA